MGEGQAKDGEGRKAKPARAGRAALIVLLMLAAGAVVLWAFLERAPSREAQAAALLRQGDFCEYVCNEPDPSLRGPKCGQDWARVNWVMVDSGCPQGDGECWTTWAREKPHAWYECVGARQRMGKGVGSDTPPDNFSPYTVVDPRVKCNDENCVKQWAAGTWYVNALARPVFPSQPRWERGMCIYECEWKIDPSRFYWFFGEAGECYACNVCIAPPTATPPPLYTPTATPQPTECIPGTPTPPPPTAVPPTPAPLPGPPEVGVLPVYYVRSPRMEEGMWHELHSERFYWLWQLQLYIRPWAEVDTVTLPVGCTQAGNAEVTGAYITEVGPENWAEADRGVCPPPQHPDRSVSPRNTIYGDQPSFCGWRNGADENYAVRLLWSREPMQPKQEHPLRDASLNQYDITPWTQKWVLIRYYVKVYVPYKCGEFQTSAEVYAGPITLRVGLVKPVRPYIPPPTRQP